jgi:tetratricopeptide (TPR) repeat protein
MESTPAQKAVEAALKGEWDDAVRINLQILETDKHDVDALNRLAKAYLEIGKIALAKETAQKVIAVDPFNSIALKCLDKWKSLNNATKSSSHPPLSSEAFLEESGKTKIVSLINTAGKKILAPLNPGEEVKIASHAHKVSITTNDNQYLGRLPDDISARLRFLIKSGVKYQALIKSVNSTEIAVFIRETERGSGKVNVPSFPTEKIEYVSFTPPELIHKEAVETGVDETHEE